MNPLRSIGPTLHVGAAAGAAGAGGRSLVQVLRGCLRTTESGAGVCAPAVSAIAIAAPAIDRRIAVRFDCIDTIPPRKDLCMMGMNVLRHSRRASTRPLERRKWRQESAMRCAHMRLGLPALTAGNRVVVKGAWIDRNELSPVTQMKHKEAMKMTKRFFMPRLCAEIVDKTAVKTLRSRIAVPGG